MGIEAVVDAGFRTKATARCRKAIAAVAAIGAVVLLGGGVWAFIDAKFTPVDLVAQSDAILVGKLTKTSGPNTWLMKDVRALKSPAPSARLLNLSLCRKDEIPAVSAALPKKGSVPFALFSGTFDAEKKAYLHVDGTWLEARHGDWARWNVVGVNVRMLGTYAGGTDTLTRMTGYVLHDKDATVPVTVGTGWGEERDVARAPGPIRGMSAVTLKRGGRTHLFVASEAGDRLFRSGGERATFADVTDTLGLDTRSRRFAWIDLDLDGRPDFVTWDGQNISARRLTAAGVFETPGTAIYRCVAPDLRLAAASVPGKSKPSVLVSGCGMPFFLAWDAKRGWRKRALTVHERDQTLAESGSICVVADFDNDGYVDALQPGAESGLFWKGQAGGFARAIASPVAAGKGPIRCAVGDYDEDGYLDAFVAGAVKRELWENDRNGSFNARIHRSGSLGHAHPGKLIECRATDINHDGRQDISLLFEKDFTYHFNRGFRTFGEEGELKLRELVEPVAAAGPKPNASVSADFNGDGAQDLLVGFEDGRVYGHFNDQFGRPGVRISLRKGIAGPVTASLWRETKYPVCLGTRIVPDLPGGAEFSVRDPGNYVVRWSVAGKAGLARKVSVGEAVTNVELGTQGTVQEPMPSVANVIGPAPRVPEPASQVIEERAGKRLRVEVLRGSVVLRNKLGEVKLKAAEVGIAEDGSPPRILHARPE